MSKNAKNQTPPPNPGAHQPVSPFSETLPDLIDALECLYIKNNPSGRRLFVENWPAVTSHIFDKDLLGFDENGVAGDQDKTRRADLERQAEANRIALLETLENIEKKSINDGLLQIDYVEKFIKTNGKEMALHVYAEHIIEKFVQAKGTQDFSEEELNVGQSEQENIAEEEEEKVPQEDETLLSAEQRAEILSSLGPKLPELEEEKKEDIPYEKRGPKRTKLRDKSYRPPVVTSAGTSEDSQKD